MPKSTRAELHRLVYERAKGCCEYCQTCEANTGQTMQVDHIDPEGGNVLDNLCLACWNCNNAKRKVTDAIDPEGGESVPLFNPRSDKWIEHFTWDESFTQIIGLTPTGRATMIG